MKNTDDDEKKRKKYYFRTDCNKHRFENIYNVLPKKNYDNQNYNNHKEM